MGLYELCSATTNKAIIDHNNGTFENSDERSVMAATATTLPAFLNEERCSSDSRQVFYISDLHLDSHIVNQFPEGATDLQVTEYINSIVESLFAGELSNQVKNLHRNPVVFFGGDTAASFAVAELFYQSFMNYWNRMEDEEYNRILSSLKPVEEEIDRLDEGVESWACHHGWTRHATKPLTEYASVPEWVKDLARRRDVLYEQQNELDWQLPYNWESLWNRGRRVRFCYVVLGNHEYWDFDSYSACVSAYSALFSRLDMTLLNSESTILGDYSKYMDEEDDYSEEMIPRKEFPAYIKAILLGGTGWAQKNTEFNAAQGIYGLAIDSELEKELSRTWLAAYMDAKKRAKESHAVLIVLSHMPMSDWLSATDDTSNCVFFFGHTHRNIAYSDECNRHILADNQIGYFSNRFEFRQISIYEPRNPYAGLSDGLYETTTATYREFYRFLADDILGTGHIDNAIRKGGKLHVIKEQDYYGFFVTSAKFAYICNGGHMNKLPKQKGIEYFADHFSLMVSLYVQALSPLRNVQERLASLVKSFGGSGRIHGTIIDIDFFNHIMISPYNGEVTFYNSPVFGMVKRYDSLRGLLQDKCPEYAKRFIEDNIEKQLPDVNSSNSDYTSVDIKNSPYRISTRINALQRLFSGHVLRAWNDEALQQALSTPGCRTKLPQN